jgi:hypothetical protein
LRRERVGETSSGGGGACSAAAMRIEEVQSAAKKQRIATHTHIKGLGLDVRAHLPRFSVQRGGVFS